MKIFIFPFFILLASPASAGAVCSFVSQDGYLDGGKVTFFDEHAILQSASGREFVYRCDDNTCVNEDWALDRSPPIHLLRLLSDGKSIVMINIPSSPNLGPEISERPVICLN